MKHEDKKYFLKIFKNIENMLRAFEVSKYILF